MDGSLIVLFLFWLWSFGVFVVLWEIHELTRFSCDDCSIETWALEEAKRRLQAEGTIPEDE